MNLPKNWLAKVLSFLLAVAIWFLIKDFLKEGGMRPAGGNAIGIPQPIIVPEPKHK
jgi:hypothetical protein